LRSDEMNCEICNKKLNKIEIKDSKKFIGGYRYLCEIHLSQKMGW
jgi:hypothetical protein